MVRSFAPQGVSTHCRHGHEWTPENIYWHPSGDRICRACRRERRALARKTAAETAKRAEEKAAKARRSAAKSQGQMSPARWRANVACRDVDPEVFFPTPENIVTAKAAKKLCKACPVRAECLAEALAFPRGAHGIWGGLTTEERRRKRVAS